MSFAQSHTLGIEQRTRHINSAARPDIGSSVQEFTKLRVSLPVSIQSASSAVIQWIVYSLVLHFYLVGIIIIHVDIFMC